MSAIASTSPATRRSRPSRSAGPVGFAGLLVVLVGASLLLGSEHLGLDGLRYGLTHRWSADAAGVDPSLHQAAITVQTLRVPRTLLAVMAGAALGTAGALTQAHTHNPIAEPGLLGVTAGAALAVALGVSFTSMTGQLGYVGLALAGAALVGLLVFGLTALGPGRGDPVTLVLVGAGVTACLTAVTLALTMVDYDTMNTLRRMWVGSVAGRGPDVLWAILPFVLLGLGLAFASGPTLNLLQLGEDVATGLGVNVGRARVVGLVASTLLVGAVTAACGPITLLGLMAPHLARVFSGPDHRRLLPYAALIGADILLACDVVGRFMATGEVPVGVVTALVGAPFFILLVRYRRLARI